MNPRPSFILALISLAYFTLGYLLFTMSERRPTPEPLTEARSKVLVSQQRVIHKLEYQNTRLARHLRYCQSAHPGGVSPTPRGP